jgi:chromosome segregation ATPase
LILVRNAEQSLGKFDQQADTIELQKNEIAELTGRIEQLKMDLAVSGEMINQLHMELVTNSDKMNRIKNAEHEMADRMKKTEEENTENKNTICELTKWLSTVK